VNACRKLGAGGKASVPVAAWEEGALNVLKEAWDPAADGALGSRYGDVVRYR